MSEQSARNDRGLMGEDRGELLGMIGGGELSDDALALPDNVKNIWYAHTDVKHIWYAITWLREDFSPVHSAAVVDRELRAAEENPDIDESITEAALAHRLMRVSGQHDEVTCKYCLEWIHA